MPLSGQTLVVELNGETVATFQPAPKPAKTKRIRTVKGATIREVPKQLPKGKPPLLADGSPDKPTPEGIAAEYYYPLTVRTRPNAYP